MLLRKALRQQNGQRIRSRWSAWQTATHVKGNNQNNGTVPAQTGRIVESGAVCVQRQGKAAALVASNPVWQHRWAAIRPEHNVAARHRGVFQRPRPQPYVLLNASASKAGTLVARRVRVRASGGGESSES